ncbi:ribose 5-phosphate isomerase B [Clostridium sp. JN-9]|nr:ribose 5-phosphate isomerase B [Clostridium sp. JN-9]
MIAIGCDHGGFDLKGAIIQHLKEENIQYKDFGTYSTESVNFPEYALKVANAVASGQCESGVLCCGTGIGMSIMANKVNGIRAAVVDNAYSARYTKMHNNANIICMGERVIGKGLAVMLFDEWYKAKYEGGRHEVRLNMIKEYEESR